MSLLEQCTLAVIQAILEWLPVSSEGFLVLVGENVFNVGALEAFQIAIYFHLGTAIAVLIKYWRTFLDAIFRDRTLLRLLIISALGTAIAGVPLYFLIIELLSFELASGMLVTLFVGVALLVTATLLRYGRIKGGDRLSMEERKVKDEFTLGVAQGFAILPGLSRSGLTITYLVWRGFKREDAFRLSFIVSLPAVLGAIALDLIMNVLVKHEQSVGFSSGYLISMAIVVVLGILMMNLLLRLANRLSFDKICYILGAVTIALVIVFYAIV